MLPFGINELPHFQGGRSVACSDSFGNKTPRQALPRQTKHAANRAQASDLPYAHETPGPQDHLLFENNTDARHRHWLVCQPLCLWTGSVNMAISTFETLPCNARQLHHIDPYSRDHNPVSGFIG